MNEAIRIPEILLIDDEGNKLGVIPTREALEKAEEKGLDLVEVAPQAKPPVCRILDYGKYKYQQQKREKDARKKQKTQQMKEMKMRPKIDEHDYNFKTKAIKSFLDSGHKVKVSVFFRGREMAYQDRGRDVLARVAEDCKHLASVETRPKMEGRYMRMMLAPLAEKQRDANKEAQQQEAEKGSDNE